ncbi:MAG: carbon starvation protein A, partial [Candidatus Dadabacteria bacterium]
AYWYHFAIMFEALFILTTIDAGTRIARFVLQEAMGKVMKPFGRSDWMIGSVLTSVAVVFAWAYFIYTGSVSTIWPMFGVANQLLAALALCVGTTILLKMGKAKYVWVTLVPMVFMVVMTLVAAWELFWLFTSKAASAADPSQAFTFRLDSVLVAVMAALAIVAVADSMAKWWAISAGDAVPAPEPEE